MATTRLTPHGVPGQPWGTFAGKASAAEPAGPHNPGTITQLSPHMAVPMRRYGSFAGKTPGVGAAEFTEHPFIANIGSMMNY